MATMGPQIQYLRHYTALFIGFSFRDRWVRRLLINLDRERQPRCVHHPVAGQTAVLLNEPVPPRADLALPALKRITMVANDARLDTGGWTCGKNGQMVPVSQGIPTVLVSNMTVGGENAG